MIQQTTDARPANKAAFSAFQKFKAAPKKIVDEFVASFNELAGNKTAPLYEETTITSVVNLILTASMRGADVDVGLRNNTNASFDTYSGRLRSLFSVKVSYVDGPRRPIRLRDLNYTEQGVVKHARQEKGNIQYYERLLSEISYANTTLFVVAGLGVVYWDPGCPGLMRHVRHYSTRMVVNRSDLIQYATSDFNQELLFTLPLRVVRSGNGVRAASQAELAMEVVNRASAETLQGALRD